MSRSAIIAAPAIRALTRQDREAVEAMTRASDSFRPEEVAVAMDVFDSALGIGKKVDPDYELAGALVDGIVAGWACWGPTPCTVGTFDLYWIVVDRSFQGKGVGTVLMDEMERRVAGRARLIVIETAGKADYAGTRAFYERRGYRIASTVSDYYAEGDDLVVYLKRFNRESGIGNRESESLSPLHDSRTPNPDSR